MANKLYDYGNHYYAALGNQRLLSFHCPGCGYSHGYHVPHWTWNGSMDKPTFTPSLLCNASDPATRCHLYMTDGRIQYLSDSHHFLAGQTVDIPDWED